MRSILSLLIGWRFWASIRFAELRDNPEADELNHGQWLALLLNREETDEKSSSVARFSDFAIGIRRLVQSQSLPGYHLALSIDGRGNECLQIQRVIF